MQATMHSATYSASQQPPDWLTVPHTTANNLSQPSTMTGPDRSQLRNGGTQIPPLSKFPRHLSASGRGCLFPPQRPRQALRRAARPFGFDKCTPPAFQFLVQSYRGGRRIRQRSQSSTVRRILDIVILNAYRDLPVQRQARGSTVAQRRSIAPNESAPSTH
jgi:hypothetical protein